MRDNTNIQVKVTDTRLFEDDMDGIAYDEPHEVKEYFDDEDEVRYWLDRGNFKPGLFEEFKDDTKRMVSNVTGPVKRRIAWAGKNFVELGLSKYCLPLFLVFVLITIYFGTIIHETMHVIAASFVGEVPVGIRLNIDLYPQIGSFLWGITGGFVQTSYMDSGNPGAALIRHSDNPLHIALIGMVPNVIIFMLGFTWFRKGLNEKRAGYFGAGLVFTCSNLEIFIPTLHTDVSATSAYIAGVLSLSEQDAGAITVLLAALTVGCGYAMSRLYDRWQRRLVEKSTVKQEEYSQNVRIAIARHKQHHEDTA
jgi:hypothetical protein